METKYQQLVNRIEAIRYDISQDKAIPSKTRNKVNARLEDSQAALYKAMHDNPDYGKPLPSEIAGDCICPEGVTDLTCPIHGH